MLISTIIATVGRPSLERAVESVLEQERATGTVEVIVVNDSRRPLEPGAWQRDGRVRIVETNGRERSVARNTGAALAAGRYLHFLDDDDLLVPGGLRALADVACASGAAWVYGATQLIDREGRELIVLQPRWVGNCFLQAMAGEWIPLQASLIRADVFFAVGGFEPRLAGPEDIDLLRRIMLKAEIAGTETTVACVTRGDEGSTTDYRRHAYASRWARERILRCPGVLERMRASATSSEWLGRIARIYFTSAVWNLQHGRVMTAMSRTVLGAMSAASAGWQALSRAYWRSVVHAYSSETFARGFEHAEGQR